MQDLLLSLSLYTVLVPHLPYQDSLSFDPKKFGLNSTEVAEALHFEHPHMNLNVIELIEMYNYTGETHLVETEDGYILKMHRIAGNSQNPRPEGKRVVFLDHGLFSSSMAWVIAGPDKGLGFILADAGYDVWMGNARGNKYSRKHKNTDISEADYWNFSWHEHGVIDLPTMIDHVLKETGREKLFYVGHSKGTTSFFVMASELPEYNDKITAAFMLGPVAFCSNMISPVFKFVAKFVTLLHLLSQWIGMHEFKPTEGFSKYLALLMCGENSPLKPLCRNILFLISGVEKEVFNMQLLPAIVSHFPAGTSVLEVAHYAQLMNSGHFTQFDYGIWQNFVKYGRWRPPPYEISNIKAPVVLHYSSNDWLANIVDVDELYQQLPNAIVKLRVPNDKFTHLDFIWGKDVKSLVYDKMMSLMDRFR